MNPLCEIKRSAQEHWDRTERPNRCLVCRCIISKDDTTCDTPECRTRQMIETAFYGDNDHNIIEALNSLQDQIEELKKEIRRLKEERVS